MRKLKLQMQQTIDGFVGTADGALDWMTWSWDDELNKHVTELHENVDLIILGRKLAEGFIPHWANAAKDPATSEDFAIKMNDTPKIVFSRTLENSIWENTRLAKGNLADEIRQLKSQPGNDIIVYGGAGFVTNLIQEGLIDELHLFVNPSAISNGLRIFGQRTNLKLINAKAFPCGIVGLHYHQIK